MPSAESRRGRRIIGSIERGAELLSSLAATCRSHEVIAGEIRASGTLESIELDVLDRATERHHPTRIGGGLELLALHATLPPHGIDAPIQARAMLVRIADPALAAFGGQVRSAVVAEVRYVIESFDDVPRDHAGVSSAAIRSDAALAAAPAPVVAPAVALPPPITAPAPIAPAPPPAAPAPITPAPPPAAARPGPPTPFVAPATSARTAGHIPSSTTVRPSAPIAAPPPMTPANQDEVWLAAGDVVVHPRFQRCLVMKVESNNEYIQVQLKNGRVVRLSLEVLHLSPRGVENGQRIFQAAIVD